MKFSAILLATLLVESTSAFVVSPSSPLVVSSTASLSSSSRILRAATLEAPSSSSSAEEEQATTTTTTTTTVASKEDETTTVINEKDWPVDPTTTNFIKDSDRILPGRYNEKINSIAIPFLPRPTALDGSHAGDYGFDPLGLSEKLDFYAMQESEVRHARLAMLAVIGWPMSELLAPDWMLQEGGCAPSVLNGVNPLSFVAIAGFLGAASFFEYKTALRPSLDTPMGKLHSKDMSAIWKYGVAGDYNWDPLALYSSCGNDYKGRKGLRDVELSHGRVAMLGITYFAAWEALTRHAIVENNMLFHPNGLFPLLVAGYVGWSQIYEVSPLNVYPIEIQYTNEGEMKYKRLQRGIEDIIEQVSASSKMTKDALDALDAKFDIYSKLDAGKKQVEETIRSAVTLENVEN